MIPAIAVMEAPCTSGRCSSLHAHRSTAERSRFLGASHLGIPSLAARPFRRICPSFGVRADRKTLNVQRLVPRAGPPEQDKGTIFEGKNVDEKDFWEGDLAGWLFKGGIVAVSVGVVALLLILAKPVIDNTIDVFPVR